MERKARENLEAARQLVDADEPSTNAATSRAYYAAYLACWTLLTDRGIEPEETAQGRYFRHKRLPDLVVEEGVLSEAEGRLLAQLEALRVLADYYPEDISKKMAERCVADATHLVRHLDES